MPRSFNHALLFTAFVALSAASCGNSATPTKATPIGAGTFVLTEWKITAPAEPIHAGTLTMTVANKGHEPHELVVVRMTDPANLPLKADGSVDEDRIAESDIIGEIEKIAAGKSGTKSFDLPAGSYVALCNTVDEMQMGSNSMAGNAIGHVHYALGMVTKFTVL